MTREEKLQRLADQYAAEFAGQGYPDEFVPIGTMTECNFGGKLIILSNDNESCIVWSDWSDEAVSDKLEECYITYKEDEDSEPDEDGYKDSVPGFYIGETFFSFNLFIRI